MNKYENLYIMLDTETTGLDTRNAVAWQVGMVAFNRDYVVETTFVEMAGVDKHEWEPSTLEFAMKTYDANIFIAATTTTEEFYYYLAMMQKVADYLEQLTAAWGYKNVYLICNHTEFDWPILLNSFTKAGIALPLTGLIHYQNKLDLQSLCRGKVGSKWPEEYKEFRAGSPAVKHLALDDCMSQIDMLTYFGVSLP